MRVRRFSFPAFYVFAALTLVFLLEKNGVFFCFVFSRCDAIGRCRWITVGEVLALLAYALVLITMVWQGTRFKLQAHLDATMPCADDPSFRCEQGSDTVATSSSLIM